MQPFIRSRRWRKHNCRTTTGENDTVRGQLLDRIGGADGTRTRDPRRDRRSIGGKWLIFQGLDSASQPLTPPHLYSEQCIQTAQFPHSPEFQERRHAPDSRAGLPNSLADDLELQSVVSGSVRIMRRSLANRSSIRAMSILTRQWSAAPPTRLSGASPHSRDRRRGTSPCRFSYSRRMNR